MRRINYFILLCTACFMLGAIEARAQLRFDTLSYVMPTTTDADVEVKTAVYRFRNEGTEPIRILKAMAGCPCTQVAYCPTDSIQPGQQDSIVASYTPRRVPGTIDETIRLELSSASPGSSAALVAQLAGVKATEMLFLHLRGEVEASGEMRWSHLPVEMGPLRLRRDHVRMDGSEVVRILCANTGDKPLRMKFKAPACLMVFTHPDVIPAGQEADLVLVPNRDKWPTEPTQCTVKLSKFGTIHINITNE